MKTSADHLASLMRGLFIVGGTVLALAVLGIIVFALWLIAFGIVS